MEGNTPIHRPMLGPAAGSEWLVGGGEMGTLVRTTNWSATPLGAIGDWPSSLRTTVSLALNSNFPISLAWGPQHIQIYNDGYCPLCGVKHPMSMGQDFTECWASAWPVIGDAFHRASTGTAAFLEDQRMFLDRLGYLEETFFTFSFSPIRDESGDIAGLFHPVTETSSKMIGQRRTRALRDLTAAPLPARSVDEGLHLVAQTLAHYDLDLPFTLFYRIEADGRAATLVAGTGIEPGMPGHLGELDLTGPPVPGRSGWPLAKVVRDGSMLLIEDLHERFPGLVTGPYPESAGAAFLQLIMLPGRRQPISVMITGASSRLPLDESCRSFHELLAAAVTSVLTNADAYQAERQRAEALAELDRARTTFFNNVSHELRTPLTLLLAPLEDELDDLTPDAPAIRRERLEMAHRNSLRLLTLVNTLLDFARIEDGRLAATFEPTDLAALTTELASSFQSICERAGLRLVVDCPPLPEPVLVDPDMWERIVLNLLSNAFKFTEQGQISIGVRSTGDLVEMFVRDTGTGIPADQLDLVFDRFHRVAGARGRSHEGTGIGLAFVRELVYQHGGTIGVESSPGQGSTFTVTIPRGPAHPPKDRIAVGRQQFLPRPGGFALVEEAMRWLPEPASAPVPRPVADGTSPRPRIIWADDNTDMRQYVYRLLASSYEVEAVADGFAALESARVSLPDLVVTDVMMPGLDGFGLLRELRADPRTHTVPVILLSARAGEASRIAGLAAGADDYLVKPFSARELLARVHAHVQLTLLRRQAGIAQRDAERAAVVAASEKQLRLITDALPILVCYVDANDRYRFTNRAYEDWFGLERDGLWGQSIRELWGENTLLVTEAARQGAMAGKPTSCDLDLPSPGGATRRVHSSYIPDIGPDGVVRGFFGCVQDETERRQAAEEIQRLNDELEERVTMRTAELTAANQDLESFSYSVSHDLRAPLRAIDGFSHLLEADYHDQLPAEAQRYVQIVRRNARNMGQLIDGLLSLAQLGRGELCRQPINLESLLSQCLDDLRADWPDQPIALQIGPLPGCDADLALLRQVWTNLLNNAVKYSQPRPVSMISIGSTIEDGEVVYFCRDNGIGFDMRYVGKLFEVFQRLHGAEEFPGSGIGLATVHRIIRRHGGRIWADSEIDHGATFYFTLVASSPGPAH